MKQLPAFKSNGTNENDFLAVREIEEARQREAQIQIVDEPDQEIILSPFDLFLEQHPLIRYVGKEPTYCTECGSMLIPTEWKADSYSSKTGKIRLLYRLWRCPKKYYHDNQREYFSRSQNSNCTWRGIYRIVKAFIKGG
jgi:hypothetical protein